MTATAPLVVGLWLDGTPSCWEPLAAVVLGGYRSPEGVKNPYLHGELHGVVRLALHEAGIPAAVVRPAMLFRYAGGSAYDHHKARPAADETFGAGGRRDAEAWALWLRAIGLDRLGAPVVGRTAPRAGRVAGGRLARP